MVSISDQKELERVEKWAQDVLDVDKEKAKKLFQKSLKLCQEIIEKIV
ncbi:MAG: hypothetical protein PG977_000169 [Bartonella clarridgeiae]|nr:MAG: hypothetical protein PG977_000169 [Bartonella clarridgeiae]